MCRVLEPVCNSSAGLFVVHLQDPVANFKSSIFRRFGVGEACDYRQIFYHPDAHRCAGISKILLELWTRGAAMAVVDMGYQFSNREVVIESVLGSFHARYELSQRPIPVLPHKLSIREEIIDDRPYAESSKHPVFHRRILHIAVGVISRSSSSFRQPCAGWRRELTRLCELDGRLKRWILITLHIGSRHR